MWKVIVVALLAVVLVMPGTASKLQTARNIKLQGAVNGTANFDGSSDIIINTSSGNIITLVGTIHLTANKDSNGQVKSLTGSEQINYPAGWTKDNCVPIAIGLGGTSGDGFEEYAFENSGENAGSYVTGGLPKMLKLKSDYMQFDVYYSQGGVTQVRKYKIVLMKI